MKCRAVKAAYEKTRPKRKRGPRKVTKKALRTFPEPVDVVTIDEMLPPPTGLEDVKVWP